MSVTAREVAWRMCGIPLEIRTLDQVDPRDIIEGWRNGVAIADVRPRASPTRAAM
jgi:hypothetical protein